MPQGEPRSGERYRHFKGGLYQIITVARHSETGEALVVYQALYGEFGVYARPFSMFVSEVEQGKYPEGKQRYRFELVEPEATGQKPEKAANVSVREHPGLLMDFYDAKTYEEKYDILTAMRRELTDVMIDNMAVVLDVVIEEGPLDRRYEELRRCMIARKKYEMNRM